VISVVRSTATFVEIAWAPATDNTTPSAEIQYFYQVVGNPDRQLVPTCSPYCFDTTGTLIARPAPGTSITVTVTARDEALVSSLPSNTLVITG
jgi:hypothetical protein